MPRQPEPSDDYNLAAEVARTLVPNARSADERRARWATRAAALRAVRAARIFWSGRNATVKGSVADAITEEEHREAVVTAS